MILLRKIHHLVTMNDTGDRLSGVDLLVRGNTIDRIAPRIDLGPGEEARVIDCSSMVVLPGLVNLHHHFNQTLQRNLPVTQNRKLFDWLVTLYDVWANLSVEAVRAGTRLACAELLLTGCTMSSDQMYVFPSGVDEDLIGSEVEAARELGIRFHPTRGSMSRGRSDGGLPPDSVVQEEERILEDSERLIDRFHDPAPFAMTRVALAPCSPFSVTGALMRETAELARRRGVLLHTHVAETDDETRYCLERHGVRPLELMARYGWVGEDVWFAHCVHLEDHELDLLAETRTAVAHCPTSNMRLGSGVARVPEMVRRGVRVGLAVDGSASNDTSDMLGELRNGLLLHLLTSGPDAVTAEGIVRLATRGGADVLGRSEVGSLEEGKAADMVLVDLERIGYAGALSDPLAALVYSGFDHTVDYTIVDGRIVVEDRRLALADEAEIIATANDVSARMLDAAGVTLAWPARLPES